MMERGAFDLPYVDEDPSPVALCRAADEIAAMMRTMEPPAPAAAVPIAPDAADNVGPSPAADAS